MSLATCAPCHNWRRLRRDIAAPPNTLPKNVQVVCEHLDLPKPWQVEFTARIIAVQFQAHAQKLAGSEK